MPSSSHKAVSRAVTANNLVYCRHVCIAGNLSWETLILDVLRAQKTLLVATKSTMSFVAVSRFDSGFSVFCQFWILGVGVITPKCPLWLRL